MTKSKKIYAFIPARGGSKRIPQKNTHLLAGKSLIQYTLDSALKSSQIDTIVVSTDDPDVETISNQNDIKVLKRPPELAQDNSPTIEAILHFLDNYNEIIQDRDIIILLQPTSPLRTKHHIDEALDLFRSKQCDSVVSVTQPEHSPYWCQKITNDILTPLFSEYLNTRSQDLPETFIPNGALYIASVKTLKKYKTYYCPKTIPYIMDRENSKDIDEPIDLIIVESIIRIRENKDV